MLIDKIISKCKEIVNEKTDMYNTNLYIVGKKCLAEEILNLIECYKEHKQK